MRQAKKNTPLYAENPCRETKEIAIPEHQGQIKPGLRLRFNVLLNKLTHSKDSILAHCP